MLFLLALMPRSVQAQATASPPERMAYQGFLTDGFGVALATNAPKNYNILFRIWNDPSSIATNALLWTEQQTVTVDKGYFSVLLGEGAAFSGYARGSLSALFAASDASERYVEFIVRGIGTAGADVTIQPRLKLLTSPYSYLSKSAGKLVSVTGADLVTSSGSGVAVNGSVTAGSYNGPLAGSNLLAGSITSVKIANGAVGTAQLAAGAVGTAQIASGAVTSAQIAAGAVGATQIAAGAVGAAQIAGGAVGTTQLAVGAVSSGQIANGTIADVDVATNFAIWNRAGTNISYSAGDVSIGTAASSSDLTVRGDLNVYGGISSSFGGTLYQGNAPLVIESKTTNNQTLWDIKDVDVTAFANRPGGFKIRIYMQHELNFQVRNLEATILFEQPGYAANPDYPTKFIRGSFAGTGGYGITPFTLGNPAVGGGPFDQLVNEGANFLNIYDYNPAALNGGVNSKPTLPIYHLWVAFHPQVSGKIVVSDY